MRHILRDVLSIWRTLLVLILPFALLPLPLTFDTSEAKCAYGLILMAAFWVTEALPLAVTSLLPVIVFPAFGVVKVGDVCSNYIKNTSMFGLGGLSIAIAIEKWNLHKRMALRALLIFGSEPKWLMFGFMLPTWFLSMWVNNTASTAMMLPIVSAVLTELKHIHGSKDTEDPESGEMQTKHPLVELESKPNGSMTSLPGHVDVTVVTPLTDDTDPSSLVPESEVSVTVLSEHRDNRHVRETESSTKYERMCKGMSLCVAYAANIGGTGALSGTSTNLVAQGQIEIVYNSVGAASPINFATWMVFALPMSIIAIVLSWVWLQIVFLDWRDIILICRRKSKSTGRVGAVIRQEYQKLGPMTFAEKAILVHFIILILLWLTRQPPSVPGWGSFFIPGYVKDSASAILICISLFVCPSQRPAVLCFRTGTDTRPRAPVPAILNWRTIEKNFPWGVLLLLGGGYALADACQESGLSQMIGDNLSVVKGLQPWVLLLVLTSSVAILTEVTSNAATATILLPILARLAQTLGFNPLYLMFPCALSTSFAFMLPVATPPNAIVFATGHLQIKDMVKAGIGMNIICLLVLLLATNTWGDAFFKFKQLPDVFKPTSLIDSNSFNSSDLNSYLFNTTNYNSTGINL